MTEATDQMFGTARLNVSRGHSYMDPQQRGAHYEKDRHVRWDVIRARRFNERTITTWTTRLPNGSSRPANARRTLWASDGETNSQASSAYTIGELQSMEKPSRASSGKSPVTRERVVGTNYTHNNMSGKKKKQKQVGGLGFIPEPPSAELLGRSLAATLILELAEAQELDLGAARKKFLELAYPFVRDFIQERLNMQKLSRDEVINLVRGEMSGSDFTKLLASESNEHVDEVITQVLVNRSHAVAERFAKKMEAILHVGIDGNDMLNYLILESSHYMAVANAIKKTGRKMPHKKALGEACLACKVRTELEPETVDTQQ